MLIANIVDDVFLSPKVKGSWNLYIRKKGGQLVLVATFYEEWHAIRARILFRLIYGLKSQEVSPRDVMYSMPQREAAINEKVKQLNLASHNKIVRQHQQLVGEIYQAVVPYDPIAHAQQLLMGFK